MNHKRTSEPHIVHTNVDVEHDSLMWEPRYPMPKWYGFVCTTTRVRGTLCSCSTYHVRVRDAFAASQIDDVQHRSRALTARLVLALHVDGQNAAEHRHRHRPNTLHASRRHQCALRGEPMPLPQPVAPLPNRTTDIAPHNSSLSLTPQPDLWERLLWALASVADVWRLSRPARITSATSSAVVVDTCRIATAHVAWPSTSDHGEL